MDDKKRQVSPIDLEKWKGKLIVSCQALNDEALHGSEIMAKMALAAWQGGAVAIRANSPSDVAWIKKTTSLPIIGIFKDEPIQHEVYITPTLSMALQLSKAGADIIALDGTSRLNKDGVYTRSLIPEIKKRTNKLIMADIATLEEAQECLRLGADIISTTLSGYTSYSKFKEAPDYLLVKAIKEKFPDCWLNAEGRIRTKMQVVHALKCGASFVTVGSAITRPKNITQEITDYMKEKRKELYGDN